MDDSIFLARMALAAIILLISVFFLMGSLYQKDTIRKSAIQAGVAEYVLIDKESGVIEFQWITNLNTSTETPTE
jgi:hypothetical protein